MQFTDFVKVFLFKPKHREKYVRLGTEPPSGYERERFADLGRLSLPWLHREVAGQVHVGVRQLLEMTDGYAEASDR